MLVTPAASVSSSPTAISLVGPRSSVRKPSTSSTVALGTSLGVDSGGESPDPGGTTGALPPAVVVVGPGTVVVVDDVVVDDVEVSVGSPPCTANVDVSSLANALTATTPHASTSAAAETRATLTCRMWRARAMTAPHSGVGSSARSC